MGVSTDGQLSYGIIFEKETEFPWDDEKYEGDIEEWWRDFRGFVNPVPDPFDDCGNYRPGINSDHRSVGEYFAARREWLKANPLPVEVVNYCSDSCPMYMLACKHFVANRGYPTAIELDTLRDTEEAYQKLREFLELAGIETENEPQWWLSSYWG